jgi:hypothetical protein
MKDNRWYGLMILVGLAAVMTPMILLAASGSGSGFDSVVHGIESRYHAHATRIPFMALISGIAGIASHGGVHGLHLAEIENIQGPIDGAELNALVEQRVGPGWQRMIRETSRNSSDKTLDQTLDQTLNQTLIYAKPEGDRMGLLVVDLDGHEMDVVQVSVDPKHIDDDMGQFRHPHGKKQNRDNSSSTPQDKDESE